ncbi:MAG: HAD-IC family P-type ATPase [Methanobacteriaceae archaeon]|jgi:Cu+-exporting ATPase|nr:HAD-IC family P-type ATPase [Candidatus Methanorudis spinitermitis]
MNNKKEKKQIEIFIEGMECASCALNVENSINKLDGVKSEVDINTSKARVEYDPKSVAISDIDKSIEDVGFKIRKSEVILQIAGMHCVNCVLNIEKNLKSLEGVSSATVNLNTQKALVYYNKNLVSSEDMGKTIENLGFDFLGVVEQIDPDLDDKIYEKDLNDKKNRIIIGFIFSGILMGIMFTPHIFFHNIGISMSLLSLIIAIIPFIFVSYPIIKGGFNSLAHKNLDMDVMYTMGILVAFISSLLGTFNIILDSSFMFYETAIMLPSFLMLGRFLEAKAKRKTSSSIKQLICLQPKTATLLIKKEGSNEFNEDKIHIKDIATNTNEYEEKKILIDDIAIDDLLLVRSGDKIPADGLVIDGNSYIDESMITGEPIAKLKSNNDKVFAGTINQDGILKIKALHIGKETVLSQIIDLVEKAQSSKPPVQRIADKVVKYFIPTILLIAISSFIVWYLVLGSSLLFALTTLISVLVVACPCALGLATPTAVTVGIGRAAEYGILIKNSSALENAGNVSIAIFDKTGTITEGNPEISDVFIFNNDNNENTKKHDLYNDNKNSENTEKIYIKNNYIFKNNRRNYENNFYENDDKNKKNNLNKNNEKSYENILNDNDDKKHESDENNKNNNYKKNYENGLNNNYNNNYNNNENNLNENNEKIYENILNNDDDKKHESDENNKNNNYENTHESNLNSSYKNNENKEKIYENILNSYDDKKHESDENNKNNNYKKNYEKDLNNNYNNNYKNNENRSSDKHYKSDENKNNYNNGKNYKSNNFENNLIFEDNKPEKNNESELIQLIASLENNSTHPIAKAIVKKAKKMNLKLDKVDEFENIRGKGLKGKIKGNIVLAGNKSLLIDENIAISQEHIEKYNEFVEESKTTIFLVYNDLIKGIITLMDKIKNDSKKTIENLHLMKITTFMITGDNEKTANNVANELGIKNVFAEVLPNEKLEHVMKIQNTGENSVLFVGDGINDAPAISQSDVGVALGSGTDIAMENGDVVLIKGDLENVVAAIQFSKKVMTRIKENIFWAFAYNIILIPIAGGLLYPFFGIVFRPEFAGLAMALSSVTVVSLSLTLKRYVPPIKEE